MNTKARFKLESLTTRPQPWPHFKKLKLDRMRWSQKSINCFLPKWRGNEKRDKLTQNIWEAGVEPTPSKTIWPWVKTTPLRLLKSSSFRFTQLTHTENQTQDIQERKKPPCRCAQKEKNNVLNVLNGQNRIYFKARSDLRNSHAFTQ